MAFVKLHLSFSTLLINLDLIFFSRVDEHNKNDLLSTEQEINEELKELKRE